MNFTDDQFIHTYLKVREVASLGSTIGYQELADAVRLGLDMHLANDRNGLGSLLSEISTAEHLAGRPLITAVVVHVKSPHLPGNEFFGLARSHGRLAQNTPEQPFFHSQLLAVHNLWKIHRP